MHLAPHRYVGTGFLLILTIGLQIPFQRLAHGQSLIADGTLEPAAAGSNWSGDPAFSALNGGQIRTLGGVTITSTGVGASADTGGRIEFAGGPSTINSVGSGLVANDLGSSISATDVSVTTDGLSGVGARARFGGSVTLTGGKITTSGLGAHGLESFFAGSVISATDTTIVTTGASAIGVAVNLGRADLMNLSIKTSGTAAYGVRADHVGAIANIAGGTITTSGPSVYGLVAVDGAVIVANDVVLVTSRGAISQSGSSISFTGGSITTTEASGYGLFAVAQLDGVNGSIVADRTTISTSGTGAVALRVAGAASITVTGSSVTTSGTDASALAALAFISGSSSATIAGSALKAGQGFGILTNGTTFDVSLSTSSIQGGAGLLNTINGGTLNLDAISSTLTGDAITVAGSTTNITLRDGSVWTGAAVNATHVALETGSRWSITGPSSVLQDVSFGNGTRVSLLASGATALQAGSLSLGSDVGLNISGISTESALDQILISTASGITGDFGTVSVGGFAGPVDYLTLQTRKSNDNLQYLATYGLAWYANNNLANGVFTLAGTASAFDVGLVLADTAANPVTGWDGRTLTKAGAGTLTLSAQNTYTGATNVTSGTLDVTGSIASSSLLTVSSGASLVGTGVVGNTIIGSGGFIAPGHSIGTLTVAGNLTLMPGSTYQTEIASNGAADLINVGGGATVSGARVAVSALDPATSYRNGQVYRILNAGGGVTGAFADAVTTSPFLLASLDYPTANAVDLRIRIAKSFNSAANTPNQRATAGALDTLSQTGPSLALYNSLLLLDANQARAAFDSLSGEIHASAKTALMEDSHFVRDAAIERLRGSFADVAGSFAPVLAYGEDGAKLVPANTKAFAFWTQGFGGWRNTDSDGNAGQLAGSTGGILFGADTMVFDTWRLGMLAGYGRSSFNISSRNSSGSSDNYHFGVYAGTQWPTAGGGLGFRSGLAYTWHDIQTSRSVAFPGFADHLGAYYGAGTFQAFGELGYRMDVAATAFEPFVNLAYVRFRNNDFSEQGGAAALQGVGQTTNTTFTTLGLRASTNVALGAMPVTARGMLGWKHAFGDTNPLSNQAFATSNTFTIAGAPIARDSAVVEVGININLTPGATFGFSYQGQLATYAQEHGIKANLNVRF